jgi:putative oxidoreductase
MSDLRTRNERRTDLALALLRAAVGAVFVAHGAQKLFTFGLDGVAGAFGQMGIPAAGVIGPLVAFVEFLGGIALIAGLFTRAVGVGLALVMVGAFLQVHLPAGFFLPNGFEFVMTLGSAAAALAIAGAGRYSLDALRARTSKVRPVESHEATPIPTRRAA